jgi:hypothetical protein
VSSYILFHHRLGSLDPFRIQRWAGSV